MISIILPAYNAEKYITHAMDSVLFQTYQDWELIVVDDCSTDATARLIEQYLDPRIHYARNGKNLGVANSRNIGVQMASGEWIAYLDSDDAWERDKLEQQMKAAEANNAGFLFTASAFMNEDGNRSSYILNVPSTIGFRELLKQNIISCSSVLIKKELAERYPMVHDPKVHEDFVVWLKILKQEKIAACGINQPLLIYRMRKGSKSGNKWKAAQMTFLAYRRAGVGLFLSCYSFMCYAVRSIKKYSKI